MPSSDASYVRLAFKVGGQKLFVDKLRESVSRKIWDTRVRMLIIFILIAVRLLEKPFVSRKIGDARIRLKLFSF